MTDTKHTSFRLRLWAGIAALAAIVLPVLLTWAQTTATLYTDGTNFGIGTTGPTQKLQVVGTVAATSFSGDGSALTNLPSGGGWSDGGTNVYTSTTTDNVGIGTTTPNTATLEVVKNAAQSPFKISSTATGSGDYLVINSEGNVGVGTIAPGGALVVMNGNVGIGTIAPQAPFVVNGRAIIRGSSSSSVMITGGNSTATSIATTVVGAGAGVALISNGGNTLIGSDAGGQTDTGWNNVFIGNNTGVRNQSGGYSVAVGQAAAFENISGSKFVAVGRYALVDFTSTGDSFNVAVGESAMAGVLGSSTGVQNTAIGRSAGSGITSGSRNTMLGYSSGSALSIGSYNVIIGSNSGSSIATSSSNILLSDGLGTERLRIDSNGNVGIGTATPIGALTVMNGNVGIGTWSPTQRLQVIGTVSATAFVGDGSGLTGIAAGGWSDGGTNVYASTTTDNVGIGTTTPTAALLIENAGTQDSFRVNDSVLDASPFMVDANGNVGIGTTTPRYKLTNATSSLEDATGMPVGGGAGLGWEMNQSGYVGAFVNYSSATNDRNALLLKTAATDDASFILKAESGGVNRFTINAGGKVGIGTAKPVGALTVMNGNVGIGTWSPTQRLQVIGTVSATAFVGDGSGLTGIAAGGWSDGGTNVYTSTTTDNVGIGTTTPSTTLEIVKQGTSAPLMVSATATSDGDYLIVNSAGNVGIGTVSALNNKLTVNGAIASLGSNPGSITLSEDAVNGTNTITIAALSSITSNRNCTLEDDDTPFDSCITAGAGIWSDGGTNVYTSTTTDLVAIGTTTPISRLTVKGNVGIGTTTPYTTIAAPLNGMIVEGNVGIGTFAANTGKLLVMGGNVGIGTVLTNAQLEILKTSSSATAGVEQGLRLVLTDTGAVTTGEEQTYGLRTNVTRTGASASTNMGTYGQHIDVTATYSVDGGSGTAQTTGLYALVTGNTNNMNNAVGVSAFVESADTNTGGNFVANGNTPTGISAEAYPRDGGTGQAGYFLLEELSTSANTNYGIDVYVTDTSDISAGTDTTYGGNFNIGRNSATTGTINTYGLNVLLSTDDAGAGTSTAYGMLINTDTAGADNADTIYAMRIETEANAGTTAYGLYVDAGSAAGNEYSAIFLNGNIGVGTVAPVGALAVMNGNVGIGTWSPRARLEVNNTVSFSSIYNNGNSGAAITIDWNNGNIQKVTMTGNCTFTFTAPSGIAKVMLQLTQNGTGGFTAAWPGNVLWPGGTDPVLTAAAGSVDFVTCLYDGTNYYCTNSLDLR